MHTLIFTDWVPEPVLRLDVGWSMLLFLGLYCIINISDVLFASIKSIYVSLTSLYYSITFKKIRKEEQEEKDKNKPIQVDKSI